MNHCGDRVISQVDFVYGFSVSLFVQPTEEFAIKNLVPIL